MKICHEFGWSWSDGWSLYFDEFLDILEWLHPPEDEGSVDSDKDLPTISRTGNKKIDEVRRKLKSKLNEG